MTQSRLAGWLAGWRHLAIAKSHIVDLFAVLGPRGEKVSVSSEVPVALRGSLK